MFSPFVADFSIAKMAAIIYIGFSFLTPNSLFAVRGIKVPLYSIFIMLLLMVLSSFINVYRNRSFLDLTLFLNVIMFWLLLNHQRRDVRVFQNGLIWFSVSSFVVGLCYLLNIGVSIDDSMRVVVFDENANSLGIKMSVGILLLINYCFDSSRGKPIYKPWLLVMVIPMLSLLFATASRVAFIIIALGVFLFILTRKTKRRITRVVWLVLGFVVLFYGYRLTSQQEVLMSRMEKTIEEGSISGRDYIWEKYIKLFMEHPVLGVGFTGSEQYSLEVFGQARSPHNVFIEVAVYSGVLGLICFLVYVFSVYISAWLYYRRLHYIGPLITSMAIAGMLLSGQALGVKLFWVLSAYALSYYLIPITSKHSIKIFD